MSNRGDAVGLISILDRGQFSSYLQSSTTTDVVVAPSTPPPVHIVDTDRRGGWTVDTDFPRSRTSRHVEQRNFYSLHHHLAPRWE